MSNNLNDKIIHGSDMMLWQDSSVVGFATSLTVNLSATTTATTNKDSGNGWETILITTKSWTASTEHMYALTAAAGESTYDDLFKAWHDGTPLTVDFSVSQNATATSRVADVTDASGGWQQTGTVYEGTAYITSLQSSGKNGELGTYTVEYKGSGEIKKKSV